MSALAVVVQDGAEGGQWGPQNLPEIVLEHGREPLQSQGRPAGAAVVEDLEIASSGHGEEIGLVQQGLFEPVHGQAQRQGLHPGLARPGIPEGAAGGPGREPLGAGRETGQVQGPLEHPVGLVELAASDVDSASGTGRIEEVGLVGLRPVQDSFEEPKPPCGPARSGQAQGQTHRGIQPFGPIPAVSNHQVIVFGGLLESPRPLQGHGLVVVGRPAAGPTGKQTAQSVEDAGGLEVLAGPQKRESLFEEVSGHEHPAGVRLDAHRVEFHGPGPGPGRAGCAGWSLRAGTNGPTCAGPAAARPQGCRQAGQTEQGQDTESGNHGAIFAAGGAL